MYRGRTGILAKIVDVVAKNGEEGELRTNIRDRANVSSYSQLLIYLDFLKEVKILEEMNNEGEIKYKITPKGCKFLGSFKSIQKMLGEKINL